MPSKNASAFEHQLSDIAAAITFALMCGLASLTDLVRRSLEQEGFCHDHDAAIAVLIDEPRGFALTTLARLAGHVQHTIVLTTNRCPEYWDDLSDHGAQILIAGEHPAYPLASALLHAAAGARYRVTPDYVSQLTLVERQILGLLACGRSNQEIADMLGMRHQSIRNQLTTIYQKLGLADRSAALLYYWDIWPAMILSPA